MASFTCPLCSKTSHHPIDAREQYCGCCGNNLLPKECEHRQAWRDANLRRIAKEVTEEVMGKGFYERD